WPRWKKEAAFIVIFMNTIVFATCPGPLLASSTFALAGILNVSLKKIAELSGYQLLIVGAFGPIVSVLAQKYGKRPQFLFAATVGLIGTVVCIGGRSNYKTLLAGRIIQGLGATAFESLSQAAIGDTFYIHERGWRTATIVLTLACMASMVSIIGGVITEHLGWRDLFIISLPFNVAGWLATFFLLPEMQFRRETPAEGQQNNVVEGKQSSSQTEISQHEKNISEGPTSSRNVKRTYVQDLRIFSGIYTKENIFKLLAEIFIHLLNPAVLWILTISGILVSSFAGSAYILAQIWSVPPYNLNTAQNGYFFFGAFIGGIIGVSAGWMCDVSARTMSRANKGIFEAEFRIPINILAAVFLGIGWFVFMWDVDHPRPNGYYLGAFCHGCVCFGVTITSVSGGLYILDSFRQYSTEIFILQMMTKNFMFYAFSTFINDWAASSGPGEVFKVFGICSLVLLISCIPMCKCFTLLTECKMASGAFGKNTYSLSDVFGKVNRKFYHGLWSTYMPKL
ncbi:MFS general substrate transporter, partial [Glonium stellatum]